MGDMRTSSHGPSSPRRMAHTRERGMESVSKVTRGAVAASLMLAAALSAVAAIVSPATPARRRPARHPGQPRLAGRRMDSGSRCRPPAMAALWCPRSPHPYRSPFRRRHRSHPADPDVRPGLDVVPRARDHGRGRRRPRRSRRRCGCCRPRARRYRPHVQPIPSGFGSLSRERGWGRLDDGRPAARGSRRGCAPGRHRHRRDGGSDRRRGDASHRLRSRLLGDPIGRSGAALHGIVARRAGLAPR